MKALFSQSRLGEKVLPYIEEAVRIGVTGKFFYFPISLNSFVLSFQAVVQTRGLFEMRRPNWWPHCVLAYLA